MKPVSERYAQKAVEHISFMHPNLLTLLGSIPSLLFFVFVIVHWYVAALFVFVLNIFDMLDGALARSTGRVSAFGGVLDSTIDRISDGLIISAFGFAHLVRWEIVIPLLIVSYLVSYVRSRAELAGGGKVIFNVGIVERTERLLVIFLTFLISLVFPSVRFWGFSFLEAMFVVLLLLSVITFIQRIMYAYKHLN